MPVSGSEGPRDMTSAGGGRLAPPAALLCALLAGGCTALHDLAGSWEGRGPGGRAATVEESRSNSRPATKSRESGGSRPDRELGLRPLPPEPAAAAADRPPRPAPDARPTAPAPTAESKTAPVALREAPPAPPALEPPDGPLATIAFGFGSTRLDEAGQRVLREAAGTVQARGGTVRVVGHASARTRHDDPIQSKIANLTVSLDRARAVAATLQALGVPRQSISIAAMADSRPRAAEGSDAEDRRVEIFLDPPEPGR